MATEIILPRVFRQHSFSNLAEQIPAITIDPAGKVFAVASYGIDTSKTRAEQLYSHVEYGIGNGHAANRQWTTMRWYPGMSAQNVANSVPHNAGFVYFSQILEDWGNGGIPYNFPFLDDVMQKIFADLGQSDPVNTNMYRDYHDEDEVEWFGIDSLQAAQGSAYWTEWRSRFASESNARKNRNGDTPSFFSRGLYNFSNWLVNGYLDAFFRVPEHFWIYALVAEIEQKHLAIRRKTVQFAWDVLEGTEWKTAAQSTYGGTRFESPPGFIYKVTQNHQPAHFMYFQGLINTVLGDGMVHWNAAGRDTPDISRWVRSYTGGAEPFKTQWKADNASFPVTYDPNNPTHPKRNPGDNPSNATDPSNVSIVPPSFGGPGPRGQHNALAGRYMAELIKNKYTVLKWPSFRYKINGGDWVNGYYNGQNPVMGTLGDASINTLNNRNFGQHNIINQLEYRKPLCWHDTDCIIWCNPLARPNEVNFVELGDGSTFEAIGPNMRVYDK